VASAMGHGAEFSFGTAEDIWNEIRRVWPAGSGISYARLEGGGLQWPCPAEDHPGTEILHTGRFTVGDRVRLALVDFVPTAERVSEEFPFLLVTGRTLHQFNAGTMTLRTKGAELRPTDTLDISPSDAARLHLGDGTPVAVHSRHGTALLPARVTDVVRPGELFATFHTAAAYLNQVTGPYRDSVTSTPEYKVTAVRLELARPSS
jgi:formate dehydrogenase major subunit